MNRKPWIPLSISLAALMLAAPAKPQELPKPTLANSVIISLEADVRDPAEVDIIKNSVSPGLYAWLSFSVTHIDPVLEWHSDWTSASSHLKGFDKDYQYRDFPAIVDELVAAAKAKNVKLHIVLCSGLARNIQIYHEAKEEDVRNCEWYNDNNIASNDQITDPGVLDKFVFGTFSRYARKLRANVEAKAKAALALIKQKMVENPGTIVALSAWGEFEMNFNRLHDPYPGPDMTTYYAGYSPFAVLEFRDWIQHSGLYDDATGPYAGQGYSYGGAVYQGDAGLANFNNNFGTSFTTWNLRYFNWSLGDAYDTNPQDYVDPDPHTILYTSYVQNGMMPTSGPNYIPGGFDPPRARQDGNSFWNLWLEFRIAMVHHSVLDMARWANEAGIATDRYYSHQIPSDYLFGAKPSDFPNLGLRYYTSASPLTTGNVAPFGSTGATIYDIKFPWGFARTTDYILPDIQSQSPDSWAAMEYDAETIYVVNGVPQVVLSDPDFIVDQYMRLYDYKVHLINFFAWQFGLDHTIKGTNKETAIRLFVQKIRDKARNTDLNLVFTPPKVIGLSQGGEALGTGEVKAQAGVQLLVTGKIWSGEDWNWKDWGDFAYFKIYRGSSSSFSADDAHYIGQTVNYSYSDVSAPSGSVLYYKWRAVNKNGVQGPESDPLMVNTTGLPSPALAVDKSSFIFGGLSGQPSSTVQKVLVTNVGPAGTVINWSASADSAWIEPSPTSGTGDSFIEIRVNPESLSPGTYSGNIRIEDPAAVGSPLFVQVTLNVYYPGTDSAPFGTIDTPTDGSTVVGNVAVTGWALDDIEVTRVEIKRDPDPSDSPIVIGSDGFVYVGDAVFVKGARPDVEAAYPKYPNSDRAGWGFMILTNFFPNQGNGNFRIHAFAYDPSEHKTELGPKTIHCDNANSKLPFGTIDTPIQGGTASGNAYTNWGWALTPQPNYVPYDGSTILVWVDGWPLGHPVYGANRADIATLFPGYANSNGAVGYYYLDTTAYPNGLHQIAWSVIDSAGNTSGIGSRFFQIFNSGGGAASAARLDPRMFTETNGGRLAIGAAGPQDMVIQELERVVVKLQTDKRTNRFLGWGETLEKGLPVGSTLDEKTGVFSWIPGPGFLGRHVLHFAATDGEKRSQAVSIVINIVPKRYGVEKDKEIKTP
jgi:hypothetical protein